MGLFSSFKKKRQPESENPQRAFFEGPVFFYYENEYRQVNIIPNGDAGNPEEDGELTGRLDKKRISPEELENIINSLGFDRLTTVITGDYHTYAELHKDCIALGSKREAIIYEFENNTVLYIWLIGHLTMNKAKFANCLHELGQKWDLLLQDLNLATTIDLKDKNAIDNYLHIYDLKKLSEIDEELELWRGTKIRLMLDERNYGTDYFDYMLIADPCDNNFMILVNVTIGNYKEGAVFYNKVEIASDEKTMVNKKSLQKALGPDFENCYLLYRYSDPLRGPRA